MAFGGKQFVALSSVRACDLSGLVMLVCVCVHIGVYVYEY